MKNKISLALLTTAVLALTPGMSHASDDFAQGDLALVFYSLTSQPLAPTVFGSTYYVVNLGPASAFRANTQNNVPVTAVNPSISSSNIAADLEAIFGADWADGTVEEVPEGLKTTNVRMMAITTIIASTGNPPVTHPPVAGDPARTVYFSGARASLDSNQKGFDPETPFAPYQGNTNDDALSSSTLGQVNNDITSFIYNGVNVAIPGAVSGANPSGVLLPENHLNGLSGFIPPQSGGFFKLGYNPVAILGQGKLPGTANVEAAVDIFRVLRTTTGATLTSGSSAANAEVGLGQYIGAITLDSAGNLKVQAVGVPAPTGGFASWATTNNVTGGTTGDSDNDGIINLVEYALALNPAASDGAAGTFTGGTVSFNKRAEAVTNNDVTYAIQESDDLGITDPWQTVTPTANTPGQISYTLPGGSPKKFVRLVVNKVP
ncbi:hypothetical protein JIN84_06380 [Luteolibacter yonseiensis]|uniref:Uncharacterized protein n=1 Tax=Luteolibacter yonseiensis TaxID=1144680 RepID=A0A934R1J0_9BACT|nr:hypothetical protein [Luteolibacter yonseiensis]MBK1815231.1 hypothetical protein [Luteolibacter yonseiensis]